jgi:hypothetical protein
MMRILPWIVFLPWSAAAQTAVLEEGPASEELATAYDDLPLPWETEAAGDIDLEVSGSVASEVHYRAAEETVGAFFDSKRLPEGFARNENTLNLVLRARAGAVSGVADVDLDWLGFAEDLTDLASLGRPERVSPYRLQTHALYLEATDLVADGLDLRIGQQVAAWGVADRFNPTNTVNPPDLENVLAFGRQVANLMARVDAAITDTWSASAVFVPVFKPAVLPPAAPLGLANPSQMPFLDPELRYGLHVEQAFAAEHDRFRPGPEYPTVARVATPVLPEPRIENAQWALRVGGSVLEQDVGLSYYYGRTPFPVATASHTRQQPQAICDPAAPSECTRGLLETDTTMRYPRMQVIGLNLAGQVNPLGRLSPVFRPIGYRLEVGLFLPAERRFTSTTEDVELLGITQAAGEYDYDRDGVPGGARPLVVDDQPFLKWTLGLDYSIGRHVYLNVMWVHGLVDEYGAGDWLFDPTVGGRPVEGVSVRDASTTSRPDRCVITRPTDTDCAAEIVEETLRDRIGDYLVLGFDVKLRDDRLLLRLFSIVDLGGITFERWDDERGERVRLHRSFLSAEGVSAIIYPELSYNFGNGLQFSCGGFVQVGEPYTKYGDPAAGGSSVWARARYSF